MNEANLDQFHKLYGKKQAKITYHKSDFTDYVLMILITAVALGVMYGVSNVLTLTGWLMCTFMIFSFIKRHGVSSGIPLILKRPQEVIFMLIYKIQNLKPMYYVALVVLALEYLAIRMTPDWPHHVETMRMIGFFLFYVHFVGITVYRTVIFIDHLKKRALVKEILMESFWRSIFKRQPSIVLEIFHAYFTGILTHILLLAPWYLVIKYVDFSVLFLPLICLINFFNQFKFLKHINDWYYRDHWLGHNSQIEFLYLHGSHHDAIPSGMIAVAGNGFLEGVLRNVVAYPTPFYNPVAACVLYSVEIYRDIVFHQYIPGCFPEPDRDFSRVCQHSTHHFGKLEPYGFAIKLDQPGFSNEFREEFKFFPEEFSNSATLDEQLNGFRWDNKRFRWYLDLLKKYQKNM